MGSEDDKNKVGAGSGAARSESTVGDQGPKTTQADYKGDSVVDSLPSNKTKAEAEQEKRDKEETEK